MNNFFLNLPVDGVQSYMMSAETNEFHGWHEQSEIKEKQLYAPKCFQTNL